MSDGRADRSSILRNTVSTLGVRATWQSFRLVTVLVTAAALGVEEWGIYGLIVSQIDVVRSLANFGLDTAGLRWMSLPGSDPGRVLGRVIRLRLSLAALASCVVAFLCLTTESTAPHRFAPLILVSGLFAQAVSSSLVSRVQAAHEAHRLIGAQLVTGGLQLAVAWGLARAGAGVESFCALLAVSEYVNALAIVWFVRPLLGVASTSPQEARSLRRMLIEALPLGLVELVVIAYTRLGVFLVQKHAGALALGQLYAAMKVTDQFLILSGALVTSALPVLSHQVHEGRFDLMTGTLRRYAGMAFAASVTFALVVQLGAEPIVLRWRPDYAGAVAPARWLGWAAVMMFQNSILTTALNAMGRFRWVTACALVNLAVYALAGGVLVPAYGAEGAAAATLVTESTNAIVQLALVARAFRSRSAEAPATA